MVGIIFVMKIDSRIAEISDIPYADVSRVGYYQDAEAEILFTTHTIFRINNIERPTDGQSDNLWEVQLTLVGNDDNELRELMTHVKHEIVGEGWNRLGWIITKMGEHEKAKILYKTLLTRAASDRERADYLHRLGCVYHETGDYIKAGEYFERALEIKKRILPKNDLGFASSYMGIGSVYFSMEEYSKALVYYQKALEIKKLTLPPNHPDLAQSCNNIGNVYYSTGEYSQALIYYQKALEIWKITLPRFHPDLAYSYNNIGLVHENLIDYSKSLSYYQKAQEIWLKSLPPNHPHIAMVKNNIQDVKRKNSFERRFRFQSIPIKLGNETPFCTN